MKKISISLLVIAASFFSLTAQSQIISTIIGTGTGTCTGDGGLATSASCWDPQDVVIDAAGNVYLVDTQTSRIRKITVSSGIVTTIAGTGVLGFSGDGGPATSAMLKSPKGIALDAAGNIYIADRSNYRIRKITISSGIITTIGGIGTVGYSGDGGLATSAQMHPNKLAVDNAGNIYFTSLDPGIRKITVSSGIITTICGNGINSTYSGDGGLAVNALIAPSYGGVAFDNTGDLYFADCNNYRIRKITMSSGIINTVAGTGVVGNSGDGGLATSAQFDFGGYGQVRLDNANNLYISDWGNHVVRKVNAVTGIVTRIVGTGVQGYGGDGGPPLSAMLVNPMGLAFDASGSLYIGDGNGNRIRKITGIGAAGINENNITNNEINIYPNPFNSKITIVSNPKQFVQIFNTLGLLVYNSQIENEKTEIDLKDHASGIYFIKVGSATKKIIKE